MKVCVSCVFLLHSDMTLYGKVQKTDGKVLPQEFRRRQDPEFSPEKVSLFVEEYYRGVKLSFSRYKRRGLGEPLAPTTLNSPPKKFHLSCVIVRYREYRTIKCCTQFAPRSHWYSPLILLNKMKFVQQFFATMLPIE